MGRFVRRHRVAITVIALVSVVLVVIGTVALQRRLRSRDRAGIGEQELRRQKLAAEQARARADSETRKRIIERARAALSRDPTLALAWLKRLRGTEPEWLAAAELAAQARDLGVALHVLAGHGLGRPGADRGITALVAISRAQLASAARDGTILRWDLERRVASVLWRHTKPISALHIDRAGAHLVAVTDEGEVVAWDTKRWQRRPLLAPGSTLSALQLTADGSRLAALRGNELLVWRLPEGRMTRVGLGDADNHLAVEPRGRIGFTGGSAGVVREIDLDTGRALVIARGQGALTAIAATPVRGRIAWANSAGVVHVRERRSPARLVLRTGKIDELHFSRDGKQLVMLGADGQLSVWSLAPGTKPRALVRAVQRRGRGHLHPERNLYLYTGQDNVPRWVDLDSAKTRALSGQPDCTAHAFSGDGALLVSGGRQGDLRVWSFGSFEKPSLATGTEKVSGVMFASAHRLLSVTGDDDVWLRAIDLRSGNVTRHRGGPRMHSCRASAHGRYVACVGRHIVWLFGGGGNRHARPLRIRKSRRVAFSPDERTIAVATERGEVQLIAAAGGGDPQVLKGHTAAIADLAYAPDGRLVTAGDDGKLLIWDPTTASSRELGYHKQVKHVRVSADSSWIATTGRDDTARVWSISGPARVTLRGHTDLVVDIALRPGATEVATASKDGTVRLWTLAGKLIRTFDTKSPAQSVRFTPDGTTLVAATTNAIMLWNLRTNSERSLQPGQALGHTLALSPDGSTLAFADQRAKVHVVTLGSTLTRASLDEITTAELDKDDKLRSPPRSPTP